MDVTVAICTWNRAELLDATLASLARVEIPRGVTWKVIVADNNSSDGTARVIEEHANRLPLQRLFVKQQGKSHAMNAVVERLKGDLILWADDDVWFDRQWLASYVAAARSRPDAGFFGGPIIPRFLGGEPEWLRPAWKIVCGIYAERALGAEPFALDKNRLPFGANWAVRVPLQKKFGYDPKLGRRGELMLAGEEVDVMRRMLADGHAGLWTPQSSIEHLITPERTEIDAVRRYFFGCMESATQTASHPVANLLCGAWHAFAALFCQGIGSLFTPSSHPYLWIKFLMYSYCSWGHAEAYWKNFPAWLKPGPLRKILRLQQQPRFAAPLAPLLAALNRETANQATVSFDHVDAPQRRLAA